MEVGLNNLNIRNGKSVLKLKRTFSETKIQ